MALPDLFATGVTVTVLLAPDPPITIPSFGTKLGFAEKPVTSKSSTSVSASPIVKAIGLVAVLVHNV